MIVLKKLFGSDKILFSKGIYMSDRVQVFSRSDLDKLHNASIEVLQKVGIVFEDDEAIKYFKIHGIKSEGNKVFINERDVATYIATAPSKFSVKARNQKKSVKIGGQNCVFAPGYGATSIILANGERRDASMQDYKNFCKLIQSSNYIDMNGYLIVQPHDADPATVHLDMMLSTLILSDKPFIGCSISRQAAIDSLEMAGIVWGGKSKIENMPVMVGNISGRSPFQFSKEMIGGLIEYAKCGQPCMIKSSGMRGASVPIKLPGSIVVQNAMILAAVTLSQLINPGTPILYGGLPYPFNMRTGLSAIGLPEVSIGIAAAAQMASYYNLPSIEFGAITDAHCPDAQAGIESALTLSTCLRSGINLIFCSSGILSSYLAMSYEKFIIDEELCGMVQRLLKKEAVTDESIDLDEIKDVGIGGMYLDKDKTVRHCRTEFFLPNLMNQKNYESWADSGKKRIDEVATSIVKKRLSAYELPEMDKEIIKDLNKFIKSKKSKYI